MFDWDDVPEELGGPSQRAAEVEAQVEEEEERYESEEDEDEDDEELTGDRKLQSLLCLDEDEDEVKKKKKPNPKPKAKPPPAAAAGVWEDRATLRSLRISELKKRLAECGIAVPSNVVEKDDLVSLLLGNPRAAAEPRRAPAAEPRRAPAAEPKRPTYEEQRPTYEERQPAYEEQRPRYEEQRPRYEEPAPVATAQKTVSRGGADVGSRSSQTRPPTKRLEKMAADVDKEGSREGESSLQNCLKQQFQRMKEQRRRDEARRVATEQRSEAERLDLQVKEKGADGPGTYMITKKTIATSRADRGGGKVEDLIPGQIVEVLEVVECEGRVRARVADPPCWFSVLNNQSGTRFAVKDGRLAKQLCLKNTAEEQSEQKPRLHNRKGPSKFAAFSKSAASVREPSPEPQIETPAFREPPAVVEPPAPSKPSPLALAAKTGSMKKVMKVLQEGANVNASNARGETPLFTAAASGSLDVTAALLLHSADPGRKSNSGLMAQDNAPPGPVRSLLELARGNFEASAMQSVMGVLDPLLKPQMMHMLQEKMMQAKASGQDARGGPSPGPSPGAFAPPARAAPAPAQAPPRREEPPMPPRALAAEPAKAGSESALTRAAKSGSLKDVMKLLQGGADPNVADAVGETPLFEAAAHGFADVTAALLVYRGDPDKRSGTGLLAGDLTTDGAVRGLLAFFRGEDMVSEQLEFLLEGLGETMREVIGRMVHSLEASKRGLADGEVGGEAPVQIVPPRDRIIDTGHLSGAPLATAAREGDLDEVRRLLEERADPNITDELGETPLFEAVASGFDDVTALLLLHKADPERRSDAGGVAADIAVDLPGKLLLDFFKGVQLSNDDKYVIVYEALRDPEVRDAISGRFRASNMQDAYKHTLRKLRA